jgi:hypothetical protein
MAHHARKLGAFDRDPAILRPNDRGVCKGMERDLPGNDPDIAIG